IQFQNQVKDIHNHQYNPNNPKNHHYEQRRRLLQKNITQLKHSPIAHIKIAKDTTFAMLLEAQRRGHALHYVRPGGLALEGGVAVAWT
ncbi:hypothetical protein AB4142_33105, partial [Variovorax sp. 2RAF20]